MGDTKGGNSPGGSDWEALAARLGTALEPAGMDICAPLCVGWYNRVAPEHVQIPYPDGDLVLLVGNSRAIWAPFVAAWKRGGLSQGAPLDDFTEKTVEGAVASAAPAQVTPRIYYAHKTTPGELIAVQRMAHVAGLAYLDQPTHLCVHPRYSSWFGLRSLAVFPGIPGPPGGPPSPLPSPLSPEQAERAQAALKVALQKPGEEEGGGGDVNTKTHTDVKEGWKRWLAIRDAIAEGHPERYSDEQILYHYTGDVSVLERAAG